MHSLAALAALQGMQHVSVTHTADGVLACQMHAPRLTTLSRHAQAPRHSSVLLLRAVEIFTAPTLLCSMLCPFVLCYALIRALTPLLGILGICGVGVILDWFCPL